MSNRSPVPLHVAQRVEHVRDARLDVADPVARGVPPDVPDRVLRHVQGDDRLAPVGELEGEGAVVAEAVEHPAVGVRAGGGAVLALVEEQARLLAAPQVDLVVDAALAHVHEIGHLAVQQRHRRVEALELPHAHVVPGEDPGRLQLVDEQPDDLGQQRVDALRQGLHDQVLRVLIDHERRQQVALAVHQPAGGGVDVQRPPEGDGLRQPRSPQVEARRRLADGQHAQGDLGPVAEQRAADDAAARVVDDDRVAAGGEDVGDVGPVDPRVAAADAVFAAAADDDPGFVCRCHVGPALSGVDLRRARAPRPSIMRNPAREIE